MTLQELNNILKSTGYEVAYSHFNTPIKPPFITYLISNSENFIADNKHNLSGSPIMLTHDRTS